MFSLDHFIWIGISVIVIIASVTALKKYRPSLQSVLSVCCGGEKAAEKGQPTVSRDRRNITVPIRRRLFLVSGGFSSKITLTGVFDIAILYLYKNRDGRLRNARHRSSHI